MIGAVVAILSLAVGYVLGLLIGWRKGFERGEKWERDYQKMLDNLNDYIDNVYKDNR